MSAKTLIFCRFYRCFLCKKAFNLINKLGRHINSLVNCAKLVINGHHMNVFAVYRNKGNGIYGNAGATAATEKFLSALAWKITTARSHTE